MLTERIISSTQKYAIIAFISALLLVTLACGISDNPISPEADIVSPSDEDDDSEDFENLDTTEEGTSSADEFSGFSEEDCICSDLPVDSAIASLSRLGCQYQWEYGTMGDFVLNRVSLSILYNEDANRLQNEYDTHYGLVAVNVPEAPIQWENDETSFVLVQKEEQSLDAFPFKYYGDVGMLYDTNFAINISLGGSGFSGEGEVQSILQDVISCAVTLMDRQ